VFYPHIAVVPRYGNDFSIEVRHDDEGDWETYFNGSCLMQASKHLDLAMKDNPAYRVVPVGWDDAACPLNGFIFRVRTDNNIHRFFRSNIRNPFENRKVYEKTNPGSTVSFTMLGEG